MCQTKQRKRKKRSAQALPLSEKTLTCWTCGIEHRHEEWQGFCSRGCELDDQRGMRRCHSCGKAYLRRSACRKVYCGPQCYRWHRTKDCPICKTRFGVLIGKREVYCSRKCKAEASRVLRPCPYPAGSPEKVQAMADRVAAGHSAFYGRDCKDVIDRSGACDDAKTGRKHQGSAADRHKALEMAAADPTLTTVAIASRINGINPRQVQYWMALAGMESSHNKPKRPPKSKEAIALHEADPALSAKQIARRIGAETGDVAYWLAEHRERLARAQFWE